MRPPFYIRQLKLDLEAWIKQGLVPAESRDAILASVGAGRSAGRLELFLAVFGVILVGLGALSFVGANWAAMTKPTRLIVLFGAMWLAYAIALWFAMQARAFVSQAFVLLGVLLFGTNIWFIAQTYNIDAHYPDGTLLWGAGALAAAAVVPSRAALAAALAIGTYWTWQETMEFDRQIHAAFLIYWALATGLAWYLDWRPGIHLSALALIFWFIINYSGLQKLLGWSDAEILSIYILLPLAIWSAAQIFDGGANALTITIGHYAFFIFLAAFAVLHLPDTGGAGPTSSWLGFAVVASAAAVAAVVASMRRQGSTIVDVLGTLFACLVTIAYVMTVKKDDDSLDVVYMVCTLVVIIWSISRGARLDDRFVVNLSIVAFGLWVLYTYFELFSGLMDQAVFFTVGGILLIALALGLENIRRHLLASRPAASGGAST
jgi:uncharacterized membrane protein